MKVLYEILITAYFNDGDLISVEHHRQWDDFVKKITSGLTILKPAKGIWTNEDKEYREEVIPVRVACEEYFRKRGGKVYESNPQIDQIIQFTLSHYKQICVMYYVVSNNVQIAYCK